MNHHPTYIQKHSSGIYYFRIAIPLSLRKDFGLNEFKRSLHTTYQSVAILRAAACQRHSHQLFFALINNTIDTIYTKKRGIEMMGFIVKNVVKHNDGRLEFGQVEMDPNNIDAEIKGFDAFTNSINKQNSIEDSQCLVEQEVLSDIVKEYCDQKLRESSWSPKTERENRAIYALFIRIIEDINVSQISAKHAQKYTKTLQKLPPNINKIPSFKNKSIEEILAMQPDKLMSIQTINKNLNRISSLCSWAYKQGYIDKNYFENLSLSKKKRPNEERNVFPDIDLQTIFNHKNYINHHYKHPYYYWLPIIAVHSGMRIEEICQLHLSDVRLQDDIWVFDLNEKDKKKLKTLASKRLIPIHSQLIKYGILDYVNYLKSQNESRLFPELKKQRDGYSQSASKWFGRLIRKLGIMEKEKVFHSFRHTFTNELKQKRFAIIEIEDLTGHAGGNSQAGSRYGKAFDAETTSKLIESLDFSEALKNVQKFSNATGFKHCKKMQLDS